MIHKKKGVRYIAQVLTKKLNKEYPKYNTALPEARRILAQLNDSDTTVNQKNVLGLLKKSKSSTEPTLPKEMLDEKDYFYLDDYVSYIVNTPKNVVFKSKIFPSTFTRKVLGGGNYSYDELFAPFVNYHNAVMKNGETEDGRHAAFSDAVLVKTTPVNDKSGKWKKQKGKYVAKIEYFSANDVDYGWNPKKSDQKPSKDIKPIAPIKEAEKKEKVKKEKPTKKEEPTKTAQPSENLQLEELKSKERIRLAEINLEKEKYKERVSSAKELFKEKLINLAEYKDLIK